MFRGKKSRGRYTRSADPADPVRGTIVAAPRVVKAGEPQVESPAIGESFEHWWLRLDQEPAVFFAFEAHRLQKTPSDLFMETWRPRG